MKRYLIKGALALIAGLFITSCSHETEVDFVPIQDQRTQEFDKAFKEAFTSNIAPNQDWGFSTANFLSSRAGTRGTRAEIVKPDMTTYPSSIAPGPLEAGEAEYVTDWFSKNPGFSHETLTWTNYFVQHVSYKQQERGIWYHRDPLHPENDWDEVKTYNFTLDQLKVGSDQTHVYDYNATQCANGAIADTRYIKGSDTNDFSVLISWATSNESHLYKLAKITYNGKTNYYVGFTAWGENSNNGTEELGAQRKTYCDDWIIKIVPGEGQTIPEGPDTPGTEVTPPASETEHYTAKHRTTKTEYFKKRILLDYGRVFCEDLGGNYNSNRKDFDYNDVVFDAYLYKEVEYKRETVYDTYEVTVKWRGHLPKMENGNYVYNNGQLVYEENESEIEISKYTSEPEYVSGPIESPVEGSDDRATFKADICPGRNDISINRVVADGFTGFVDREICCIETYQIQITRNLFLCIEAGIHGHIFKVIDIRKLTAFCIDFPVIRVAFEDQSLIGQRGNDVPRAEGRTAGILPVAVTELIAEFRSIFEVVERALSQSVGKGLFFGDGRKAFAADELQISFAGPVRSGSIIDHDVLVPFFRAEHPFVVNGDGLKQCRFRAVEGDREGLVVNIADLSRAHHAVFIRSLVPVVITAGIGFCDFAGFVVDIGHEDVVVVVNTVSCGERGAVRPLHAFAKMNGVNQAVIAEVIAFGYICFNSTVIQQAEQRFFGVRAVIPHTTVVGAECAAVNRCFFGAVFSLDKNICF